MKTRKLAYANHSTDSSEYCIFDITLEAAMIKFTYRKC